MENGKNLKNQVNQIIKNFDLDSFISLNWKLIAAHQNGEITKNDLLSYMDKLRVLNQN